MMACHTWLRRDFLISRGMTPDEPPCSCPPDQCPPPKGRSEMHDFTEVPAITSGKRCGVQWTPWMGDYFTSWSPRNSNSNAEGPWDHWVDLAIQILQDPLTGLVRPEAQAAVKELKPHNFYDESNRELTEEELAARFRTGEAAQP